MNRYTAYFMAIILSLLIVAGLGGCGESLQKPTGLENKDSHQEEVTDEKKTEQEDLDEKQKDTEDQENNQQDGISSDADEDSVNSSDDKTEEKGSATDKNIKTNKSDGAVSDKKSSSSASSNDGINDKTKDKTKSKNKAETKKKNKKSKTDKQKKEPKKDKPKKDKSKDKPKKEENKSKPDKPTITHSIVIAADGSSGQQWCKDNPGKGGCPNDGSAEVPLPATTMEITEAETVLDVLMRITKQHKIQMDYRGGQGATAYIQGMGNVYEFDRGQGSGWMFRVNGIFPDRGAGVVPLCDGDRVEWLYTNNLGQDLGADLKPVRRDGKCPK